MSGKNRLIQKTIARKNMWLVRMMRLAASAIKWEGLPEYIDTGWMEYNLTKSGTCIVWKDSITGRYYAGQNASTGNLDIDGYPTMRSCIFRNGQQVFLEPSESVIIYNNVMRTSDYWIYELMADTLASMDMAIMVNVNSQRTMPIIPVKQEQVLSVKNLIQELEENSPYKFVDPTGLDIEAFKNALLFDNRKSFTADNIIKVQREYWNRCLTIIGINNANVEKAERVNIAEADSNMDEIATLRYDRIRQRDYACKEMKEIFGLDVRAEYVSNIRVRREGDGNGNIYSTGQDNSGTGVLEL